MKPTFKLISKYKADIRAEIIGNEYRILFISGNIRIFQPISEQEYINYRNTFYLSPGKAKNMLLDKFSFDGTPFCRKDFNYIDLIELSLETEKWLKEFIDTLDQNEP